MLQISFEDNLFNTFDVNGMTEKIDYNSRLVVSGNSHNVLVKGLKRGAILKVNSQGILKTIKKPAAVGLGESLAAALPKRICRP